MLSLNYINQTASVIVDFLPEDVQKECTMPLRLFVDITMAWEDYVKHHGNPGAPNG